MPIVHTHFFPPFFSAPFVYVVPFQNLLLFSDCFPELSFFSHTKMKSDIVYARAQASILRSSSHPVIQSKKSLNFLTRRYIGLTSGRKESASKTNQKADDRLF